MQSTSRLRNVFGEASKETIDDIAANEVTTEGTIMDVNAQFVAVFNLLIIR